jgi:drug/metabolite transporter (DMT)-like permease
MSKTNQLILAAVFVVAVAAWFILSTVLMDEVSDGTLVALMAVGAFVFTAAADVPSVARLRSLDRSTLLTSALGGALVACAAPAIVLANRFTDAPPGTETLFFTTAAWGVLGVAGALIVRWKRPSAQQMAFALIGLLGVAALVANWERPSSFSPLVRYWRWELGFLLAGLCWVGGSLLLQRLLSGTRSDGVLFVAASSGALLAFVYAVYEAGSGGFTGLSYVWAGAFALMVAFGMLFVAWTRLIPAVGVGRVSGLWFLPAVLITTVTVYEQAVSPRGPDPVIWAGALGGMALAGLGAAGVWFAVRTAQKDGVPETTRLPARITAVSSALAVLAGAISLVLPAFAVSVAGTLADGQAYAATWELLGFESAGGWIPLLAGALLFTASLGVLAESGSASRVTALAAVAGAIALGSYWFVADTPLHTWNRWIPVEIQSEYGTEYALIEFATIHDPVRLAALAFAAAAAVALLIVVYTGRAERGSAGPSNPEGLS